MAVPSTSCQRLVRLLGHSIQPIFVFDGPNKPAFKRNKRSGRGDGVATAMAKRLIRLFGFQIHDAPGEAEAECALLQQQGIVDAVLSEDVDTIMFGCTRTLRNWSADGVKGSKTPTHVSMYDTDQLQRGNSGLDREGMVLVALMSGGDYLPEGVPGCGVKLACEAARAGFGKSLCRIKRADSDELRQWRENLRHELATNENNFFRTKHKALTIPEDFPSLEILRYYTHPVVSQSATVERLRTGFPAVKPVDVQELREFVRETFDWTYRIGAVKYIRVLAPSMLVQRLLSMDIANTDDLESTQTREAVVVNNITNKRSHFSTDATPELRVSYTPADMVPIDLDAEPEEPVASYGRDGIALNSDDEFDEPVPEVAEDAGKGAPKKAFDPLRQDTIWVPESIVKLGAPLTVEDWEEKQRSKGKAKLARPAKTRVPKKADMPMGALDRFVKVTKSASVTTGLGGGSPTKIRPPLSSLGIPPAPSAALQQTQRRPATTAAKPSTLSRSKQSKKNKGDSAASKQANPWTLAGSQISPRVTKSVGTAQAIVISSSPPCPSSPARDLAVKRVRTPPPAANAFASDPFDSPTRSPRKKGSPVVAKTKAAKQKSSSNGVDKNQMSIKSFGSLVETKVRQAAKTAAAARDKERESPCIEILSDDDYDDGDEPSLPDIRMLPSKRDHDPFVAGAAASKIRTGRPEEEAPGPSRATGNPKAIDSSTGTQSMPRTGDIACSKAVKAHGSEEDSGRPDSRNTSRRTKRTVWRSSEVSIIDLTNHD
ncbi:uncharacterized protein E0L32_008454 [Thyridium curvatum]|uniref:XPG-I domain-containing protein n=1 Tax=Thyridium curvatum TaxID=1093900 RepID=A0A507B0R3_9PEZI|nr:uncharacterized protein E0L32_008454 [Thyridium curvatum]TPX10568.1 hypothetical protein E0L32_008454 [Thyridium curvatum]